MRGRVAGVAAVVALSALAVAGLAALAAARSAFFVVRDDEYGRPVSGPDVSLHVLAHVSGLSFAYVGRPGSADFDFELYRGTPAGSVVIDFRQNGVPAGAALRH